MLFLFFILIHDIIKIKKFYSILQWLRPRPLHANTSHSVSIFFDHASYIEISTRLDRPKCFSHIWQQRAHRCRYCDIYIYTHSWCDARILVRIRIKLGYMRNWVRILRVNGGIMKIDIVEFWKRIEFVKQVVKLNQHLQLAPIRPISSARAKSSFATS